MCSTHWPSYVDMTRDESRRMLRRLELETYASAVSALRARGELTKDKKKLLSDLQQHLSISAERHRAEVRRAVNDEKLATIAKHLDSNATHAEWLIEGRRLVPLMPRLVPHTILTPAAHASGSAQAQVNQSLPPPASTGKDIYAPPAPPLPPVPQVTTPLPAAKQIASPTSSVPANHTQNQPSGVSSVETSKHSSFQTRVASPPSSVVVLPSGKFIHIKGAEDEDWKLSIPLSQSLITAAAAKTPLPQSISPSQPYQPSITARRLSSNLDNVVHITHTPSPSTMGQNAPRYPPPTVGNSGAGINTQIQQQQPQQPQQQLSSGDDCVIVQGPEVITTHAQQNLAQSVDMRSPGITQFPSNQPGIQSFNQTGPQSAVQSTGAVFQRQNSQSQKIMVVSNAMGSAVSNSSMASGNIVSGTGPNIIQRQPQQRMGPGGTSVKVYDHIVSIVTTANGTGPAQQAPLSSSTSTHHVITTSQPIRTLPRTRTIITRPRTPICSSGKTHRSTIVIPSGGVAPSGQNSPTVQIRHEGGMKIITHASKILPKPGNSGSGNVVVTTAPTTPHSVSTRTMAPGSKVMTVTSGTTARVISTGSRSTVVGGMTPKHVQISSIRPGQTGTVLSSGGRVSGTPSSGKPNVIVVQKGSLSASGFTLGGGQGTPTITRKLVTSLPGHQTVTSHQIQTAPRTPPAGAQIIQSGFEKDFMSFIEKHGAPPTILSQHKIERRLAPRLDGTTQKITVVRQRPDGTTTSQPMIITGATNRQSILSELVASRGDTSAREVYSEDAEAATSLQMEDDQAADETGQMFDQTVIEGVSEVVQLLKSGSIRLNPNQTGGFMTETGQSVQLDMASQEELEQLANCGGNQEIIGELDPNTGILYTTDMIGNQQAVAGNEIASITPLHQATDSDAYRDQTIYEPNMADDQLERPSELPVTSRHVIIRHNDAGQRGTLIGRAGRMRQGQFQQQTTSFPEGRILGKRVLEHQVITSSGVVRHLLEELGGNPSGVSSGGEMTEEDENTIRAETENINAPASQSDFLASALNQAQIDLHQLMEDDPPTSANQIVSVQIPSTNQIVASQKPSNQNQPVIIRAASSGKGAFKQRQQQQQQQQQQQKQFHSRTVYQVQNVYDTESVQFEPVEYNAEDTAIGEESSVVLLEEPQKSDTTQITTVTREDVSGIMPPSDSEFVSDVSQPSNLRANPPEIESTDGHIEYADEGHVVSEHVTTIEEPEMQEPIEECEESSQEQQGLMQQGEYIETQGGDGDNISIQQQTVVESQGEVYEESEVMTVPAQDQYQQESELTATDSHHVTAREIAGSGDLHTLSQVASSQFMAESSVEAEYLTTHSGSREQIEEEQGYLGESYPGEWASDSASSVLSAAPGAYSASGNDGIGKRKRKPPMRPDDDTTSSQMPTWARLAQGLLYKVTRYRGANKQKHEMPAAYWFNQPVDRDAVPDYYNIIINPMDFGTIRRKLEYGEYNNIDEFHDDMLLVRSNCLTYNQVGSVVRNDCEEVFSYYIAEYQRLLPKLQQTQLGSPTNKKPRMDRSPIR